MDPYLNDQFTIEVQIENLLDGLTKNFSDMVKSEGSRYNLPI